MWGKLGGKYTLFKIPENPYLRPKTIKLQEPTLTNKIDFYVNLDFYFMKMNFIGIYFQLTYLILYTLEFSHKFCELIKLIESI